MLTTTAGTIRPATVLILGAGVAGLREGQRVVLHHHIPCASCFYCARRVYAQCEIYKRNGTTAGFEPTSKRDRKIRRDIFIRDGFTCQICGAKPVEIPSDYDGRYRIYCNRKSKAGYPLYLVVDHIKPWKKGGTISKRNLQCLCEGCNAAKGDR